MPSDNYNRAMAVTTAQAGKASAGSDGLAIRSRSWMPIPPGTGPRSLGLLPGYLGNLEWNTEVREGECQL